MAFSATQTFAMEGVVTSIKPVHSLVAAIIDGTGEPQLLVKGAASPHTYTMRPSEAGMLEDAKVIFWVGEGIETFLEKPLDSLAGGAKVVTLSETPGITLLDMREGGAFEPHSHGDEEHDHEGEEAGHDHGEEHADHHHGHGKDMHVWLDPENARLMAREITSTLVEADPQNAATYEKNAAALDERLGKLISDTEKTVEPVRGKPFIVFHDAYHYFENRFGVEAAGSITVSPEQMPSAQRLQEIRDKVTELNAACVFAEPQFEPKFVNIVTEGTDARTGMLDPEGANIDQGPDLYFTLVGNLAKSLADCLSGAE
ncbi:zinc ABC transporter substrate-binding protein ZnuA [Chelativorans sp. AA-79]|uniref:zinc ABC transporter substrate-binding protein ZnuA n=1 Tax=Chelativorans sp. AA-79 TaxID=3028735 RepID=UPI0023F84308|nr:zinc ABC transporter substrate-binding protein ZnuA [Chelativorans sp. AA-79]WEX12033.1 zinc ABC transporter substrate-binding protein ZnuA [Chelativorans sp. AA-79]